MYTSLFIQVPCNTRLLLYTINNNYNIINLVLYSLNVIQVDTERGQLTLAALFSMIIPLNDNLVLCRKGPCATCCLIVHENIIK
jgi:hypothetical protein